MKIAVVGSWKTKEEADWHLQNRESFPGACRQIGNAIMRLGHSLVIGSDNEDTADLYAVEGAVQVISGSIPDRPRIIILRPNDKTIFDQLRNQNPGLFATRSILESRWNATKLLQVNEADAVLVVGGADFSYQAGLATVISRKPLVPIGSFGGAGKDLLDMLAVSRNSWPGDLPSEDDLGLLQGGWDRFLLDKTTGLLGLSRQPKLLIIHGRSDDNLKLKNYLQNELHLPEPLIMAEEFGSGSTLPDKFEAVAQKCDGAIALATPDDLGAPKSDVETDKKWNPRARQNVWLEVGWFWGALGRGRFLLLCNREIEIPSDLSGVDYSTYQTNPTEIGDRLRRFVEDLKGKLVPRLSA